MQYILNFLRNDEDFNSVDAGAIVFPLEAEGYAMLPSNNIAHANEALWEAARDMASVALEPVRSMMGKSGWEVAVVHIREPLSVSFFPDPHIRTSGWRTTTVFAVTFHSVVPKRFQDRGALDHFPLWVSKPNIDKNLNGTGIAQAAETLLAGWGEKPPQGAWAEDL